MRFLLTSIFCLFLSLSYAQSEFITTWKTDNPGVSEDNQITIPTYLGETYDYTVDWGDGTSDSNVTGDIIHTYAISGTYQVSILGTFPRIYHEILDGFQNDSRKLISIDQWGNQSWSSMEKAFAGCENMDITALDVPDLSNVDSMDNMFSYCFSLIGNDSFSNWDVSNVNSMSALFFECYLFNQNIGNWNVSNLVEGSGLFFAAESFNQDIGNWDVSSLKYMGGMFNGAINFNQDIGNWDVSNVTNFNNTFARTDFFNQDLSKWDVSSAIIFSGMFNEAIAFNQDISNWNTANARGMEYMFDGATSFNQDISTWDVGLVTSMQNMFAYTTAFNQNIFNWDVSSVSDMSGMFRYAKAFDQPIGNWDVSNVTDISFLFEGASSFNQDISNWDVSSVTIMFRTFTDATLFNQPIGNWNVSNVTNMEMMFWNTVNFNQPLNNWNVSSVTTMKEMFSGSLSFNQDINNWEVSNVETMLGMFVGASSFNNGLNSWNTGSVNDMNGMFFEADNFNQPIDNWDLSSVTNLRAMFFGADAFNQPISNWDVSSVTDMSSMFERATAFSQNLGNWNIAQVTTMQNMFNDVGISQENYDETLIGWANLPSLQENVQFNAGSSKFCAGESARLKLINNYGWEIIDGGKADCPFITTWKTDNPGVSNDNRISIPIIRNTTGYNYNYTVDWGDGTADTNVTDGISHTYENPGTYQIAITGDFPAINFYNSYPDIGDEQKLITVDQWGSQQWLSMQRAFHGCTNLDVLATDIPDLSNVSSMGAMFDQCQMLIANNTISNWDTSTVEDMGFLFSGAHLFNQDISTWDVSNVKNMSGTFINAFLFNQDIGNWNVSNVEDMSGMFSRAFAFNRNIGNWNVSKVVRMGAMFFMAEAFNQEIGNWNTQSVNEMDSMFNLALSFNQPIGEWNISNVIGMNGMFRESNFDQDISNWDIQNVENLDQLFYLTQISQENYDLLLNSWSTLPNIKPDLVFNAGTSQFCNGEEGRQKLQSDFGWIITDGGKIPFCNEDNDLDGILDHLDDCLDTRPNVLVNERGCEIIATDAILVYGATPTCPGEANGSISISSALTDYIFNIAVEGPVSTDYNEVSLNENLEIPNLTTGLYTVTISIPDISYSQTYGIHINEVGTISGKRESLNTTAKTAFYNVEGSYTYIVDINGELKNFSFTSNGKNEIQLSDLSEFNAISITGESDCQGMVTDSFAFSDGVIMFPTITSGEVFIQGNEESSTVLVYDLSGKLVLSKTFSGQGLNSIDLQVLETGIYPTVIQLKQHSKTFKIIKQ